MILFFAKHTGTIIPNMHFTHVCVCARNEGHIDMTGLL